LFSKKGNEQVWRLKLNSRFRSAAAPAWALGLVFAKTPFFPVYIVVAAHIICELEHFFRMLFFKGWVDGNNRRNWNCSVQQAKGA
jgi:hypothetical protein